MRKAFLFLLICFPVLSSAQLSPLEQFEERTACAARLLVNQPDSKHVQESLPSGFTLDYLEEFKYHLKDPRGVPMIAYLHIKTLKIVTVEFVEPKATFAEVQKFLTDVHKFEWVGCEHQWNYFNDKKIAIAISPEMTVHVSMYDL